MFKLTTISIYPIKSLGKIDLPHAELTDRGLKYDRRWMLVDADGKFITQRKFPRMARIQPTFRADHLHLTAPDTSPLTIPLEYPDHSTEHVRVWESICRALRVSREADEWFSDVLNIECHLVYMPDSTRQPVDPDFAVQADNRVSFADGYPFLLISQASLDDLNSRLEEPILMDRFRPNLVVEGCEPFAEDTWQEFTVGDIKFYGVKPCSRCSVTTVDQATGARGKEPLKTLATYRNFGGKVMFGMNLIAESTGAVRVGDPVEVIRLKPN